jgi:hypothetical protein
LEFVGSNFKERVVEFFLIVSGTLFYHLILRPKDYCISRKKNHRQSPHPAKKEM